MTNLKIIYSEIRNVKRIYSDEIDPITAVRKTDMKAERILSFTHPRLKKFL